MTQTELFIDAAPRHKLPTSLTSRRHPIHRWYNFIAGFSPEFVQQCIREERLGSDDAVVDPFAGLCTVLVQANLDGVCSFGFEAHPFFYDISLAKIFLPRPTDLPSLQAHLESMRPYSGDITEIWGETASAFLSKLIPDRDLRILGSAVQLEGQLDTSLRPIYRLIVSKVLELTAHSETDGIYKAPTTGKRSLPYETALAKTLGEIEEDLEEVGHRTPAKAILYPLSSERMTPLKSESCSLCITSPPYLNNFDFAEMTRMELYFWRYADCWSAITERVRRRLIVNTTTAPGDLKRDQAHFSRELSDDMRSVLEPLALRLKEKRAQRPGKKDYWLLVYPYFAQMQRVFVELRRVLRSGAGFHLVVADAALYGVHIKTESLLAQLMNENGFEVQSIERLRFRGHRWKLEKRQGAGEPLGEFHVYAKRRCGQ